MNIDFSQINNIASNYKKIDPGYMYVALKGEKFDGTQYINEAIKRGARYVLLEGDELKVAQDNGIIYCYTPSIREAISFCASRIYTQQPATIVAVTGTNGKTSTVDYYRQIAQHLGYKSGCIGTIGAKADSMVDWCEKHNEDVASIMTTPDAIDLHYLLHGFALGNITHAAIEASSHGISQYRLDNVHLEAAGFTNLTHEHLDYHGDMGSYFNAKLRLFERLLEPGKYAVINAASSDYALTIIEACKKRGINFITYNTPNSDLYIASHGGNTLNISAFNELYSVASRNLLGFHLENIMCALGLAKATLNEPFEKIVACVSKLVPPLGRMDMVAEHNGAYIYIDYAHTPDALKNVMMAVRSAVNGINKLHVLFGCGGDRDKTKRPVMGAVASEYADKVIITDDNPRTENPEQIRLEIMEGTYGEIEVLEISDRKLAIASAIDALKPGDALIIAGKGHECHQVVGTEYVYFSDYDEVRRYTQNLQL